MKYWTVILILWFCFSCTNKKNKGLLEDTFEIIQHAHWNIQVTDDCHCIMTGRGGEVVDTIIKKIDFGELDLIRTLVRDEDSTYISYYHFEQGVGIDILYLTALPPPNPRVTEELYKELEYHNDVIGFSCKNEEQLNLIINNIKKIAKKCGASVSME